MPARRAGRYKHVMAAGVPLTTEQLEKLAEAYARLGTYSAAAEVIGCDESTARKALKRLGSPDRSAQNTRAVDRGIKHGTARLRKLQQKIADLVEKDLASGNGMEPRDIASLVGALNKTVDTFVNVSRNAETRAKLRAETELIRAKAAGTAAPETVVVSPGDEAFEQLMIERWGHRRQGVADVERERAEAAKRQQGSDAPVAAQKDADRDVTDDDRA